MAWEKNGVTWFYDVSWRPTAHGWTSLNDRRAAARATALRRGWPVWMAEVEAAVTA